MNRIVALTLLCTATLTMGVVVATPSLATVFRSHHSHVRRSPWLWDWSVSGGTTTTPALATTPQGSSRPAKTHSSHGRTYAAAAATTSPPATTEPPSTSPPPGPPDSGPPHPAPGPGLIPAFTLRSVDARCFLAASGPGGWPFAPTTAVHPIRGSFDEPRTPVHMGVDVEAPRDKAPVYAMQAGKVSDVQPDHFNVVPSQGPKGRYLQYWHVNLDPAFHAGTVVRRGERLGTVKPGMLHVHISEYVPGCGLVDPARPQGLLADPYNIEWPSIGTLSAMVAGPRAFVPLNLGFAQGANDLVDPARPMTLDALSGTVDLRTSVTDMPKVRMQNGPQLQLAPAAIRAYLAPAGKTHRHVFMRTIFDGSRPLPSGSALWHSWAFGTYRQNSCYFATSGTCGMEMIWHVGGPNGFDTTTVPNGSYKYCVEALTIAGVDARRCTPVKIAN